ncbi:P-loop containing nucleoside triphosphate hydrolase protein [Piedraia hortae CBS 480.64]|uniref:ATP-dependent RNA helicase SUV3, mitochondrial n=1 Tax=Piedraia hortae CBS 480.64 TaxID=1314780 RepID=A0A6A7C299_9PEZI|nr:P-loop containing nucleoside triphosphate hydrolase protein [Piedraia hortae CBS 480.64]
MKKNGKGLRGLENKIRYAFYDHITSSRFNATEMKNQKFVADLRHPAEWFPKARMKQRKIYLHVGPTNSGKTYQALKRMETAKKAIYAGPLRLLAHEVYSRMNAKGRACSLITGEERRVAAEDQKEHDGADLCACTVEMMSLSKEVDVAVIDEIQMIGNAERGWAWTQALLGVRADEVHLCGEKRTVPLIKEICASVGDVLEVHEYERLSPFRMDDKSLDGNLKLLRKGDCVVSFSVMGIHALRKQIETQTGKKVAIVYGSLPPETRAQQARLFNDPDNDYDFLVASDAVGMGLNLAIKRIVFETCSKFDGYRLRTVPVPDIKQIAGRAGRYRTATQGQGGGENVGLVTTLEKFDYPLVAAAMQAEPSPIKTAGLFPPCGVLERFSSYFPVGTPFSYILMRLHELSEMHPRFHLCGLRDQTYVADLIEPIKGLTIADRNIICATPTGRNASMWSKLMPAYARCIAEQRGGHLADIKELPLEDLERPAPTSRAQLANLEKLHQGIVAYLWLSYRFAGIFPTRSLAFYVKGIVETKIEEELDKLCFTDSHRRKHPLKKRHYHP